MKRGVFIATAMLFATNAGAAPVKIERNSPALEFSYEYPSDAATVTALSQRFRAEANKAFKQAMANARGDQKLAHEQKRDYNPEFYSKVWTTAGQTARLLSLQFQLGTFTGGAHPNTSYGALLWDHELKQEISVDSLFRQRGSFPALTRNSYCHALNRERMKRREGERLDLPEFNECPKYSDLAISPLDKNKNGRFDTIMFVASPYTVGPYAEGEYEISLPITSQLIAGIKPDYRNSFERQRQ